MVAMEVDDFSCTLTENLGGLHLGTRADARRRAVDEPFSALFATRNNNTTCRPKSNSPPRASATQIPQSPPSPASTSGSTARTNGRSNERSGGRGGASAPSGSAAHRRAGRAASPHPDAHGRRSSSESRWTPPKEYSVEEHMRFMRNVYLLPYVMSGYLQLAFNILIVSFCAYVLWTFCSAIQEDINSKIAIFSDEIRDQMLKCSKDYRENKCEPTLRVPAMEALCRSWEQCMAQDAMVVAERVKFSAETIGEGVNSFFDKISWKAISCICLMLFGIIFCYNAAFYFASKQRPVVEPRQMDYGWIPAPRPHDLALPAPEARRPLLDRILPYEGNHRAPCW